MNLGNNNSVHWFTLPYIISDEYRWMMGTTKIRIGRRSTYSLEAPLGVRVHNKQDLISSDSTKKLEWKSVPSADDFSPLAFP
jgi:uncharacterized membrane protein